MSSLRKTALHAFHRQVLSASTMAEFAGYDMPIQYKGLGILKESLATRNSAGFFDVSHMGQARVRGKDRRKFVEKVLVGDPFALPANKCSLSLVLTPEAGILDDVIFSTHPDHINIVLNAGNKHLDFKHFLEVKKEFFAKDDVQLEFVEGESLLAIQGPRAAALLQPYFKQDLSKIGFSSFFTEKVDALDGLVTAYRTGYTGEDGFELALSDRSALILAEKLFEGYVPGAEGPGGLFPAGLGARDALRLEAGLCLHGHEISTRTSPIEALLMWTVRKRDTEVSFIGAERLSELKKSPPGVKRTGISMVEGGICREGMRVSDESGQDLGTLTSGTFSPVLKKGIGMIYLPNHLRHKGTKVLVDVRGRKGVAEVVDKLPFVPAKYYKLDK